MFPLPSIYIIIIYVIRKKKKIKSHFPHPGIEHEPPGSKSCTLTRRCKSRLLPPVNRRVFYTLSAIFLLSLTRHLYAFMPIQMSRKLLLASPVGSQAVTFTLATTCNFPHTGIEPEPLDSKSCTLPRRYKTGLFRKTVELYVISKLLHIYFIASGEINVYPK